MVQNLEELRVLLKEYHLLSSDEQTAVRHALYAKHGKFGKQLKEIFEPFKQLEAAIGGNALPLAEREASRTASQEMVKALRS